LIADLDSDWPGCDPQMTGSECEEPSELPGLLRERGGKAEVLRVRPVQRLVCSRPDRLAGNCRRATGSVATRTPRLREWASF